MQLEFFDVPSPCIGICQSNDKGQCLGCFRTRLERQSWTSINSDEKQKIIKRSILRLRIYNFIVTFSIYKTQKYKQRLHVNYFE